MLCLCSSFTCLAQMVYKISTSNYELKQIFARPPFYYVIFNRNYLLNQNDFLTPSMQIYW